MLISGWGGGRAPSISPSAEESPTAHPRWRCCRWCWAGLLWGWDRWQTQRGTRPEARLPVRFGWLYPMAFIGCLSHPFFDWLNVYGIRLLEPFSSQWFYGDTLFYYRRVVVGAADSGTVVAIAVARKAGRGLDAACTGGDRWQTLAYIGANWAISVFSASFISSDNQVIASPAPLLFVATRDHRDAG